MFTAQLPCLFKDARGLGVATAGGQGQPEVGMAKGSGESITQASKVLGGLARAVEGLGIAPAQVQGERKTGQSRRTESRPLGQCTLIQLSG